MWTRRPLVHFYRLCWRARSGGMSAASASYRGPPPEFRWPMTRPGRVATFHRANKAARFVTAHSLKPRQDSAPERGAALQERSAVKLTAELVLGFPTCVFVYTQMTWWFGSHRILGNLERLFLWKTERLLCWGNLTLVACDHYYYHYYNYLLFII